MQNLSDLHSVLEKIDHSTFSKPPSNDDLKKMKKKKGPKKQDAFEFDLDSFGFGSAGGQSSFSQWSSPNMNLHANNFFKNPSSIKKLLHHHRASMGKDFSMPKLSKFTNFHKDEITMAKHQIRVDALGDTCAPRCELGEDSCLCERLFECVNDMTEYGKLLMFK